jgi:hypothetical protein
MALQEVYKSFKKETFLLYKKFFYLSSVYSRFMSLPYYVRSLLKWKIVYQGRYFNFQTVNTDFASPVWKKISLWKNSAARVFRGGFVEEIVNQVLRKSHQLYPYNACNLAPFKSYKATWLDHKIKFAGFVIQE